MQLLKFSEHCEVEGNNAVFIPIYSAKPICNLWKAFFSSQPVILFISLSLAS